MQMSSDTYNRETIDAKLDRLADTLKEIHEQTKRTNGRVSSLEKWRFLITGIAVAAAVMATPNLSLLAKLIAGQ